MTHWEPSYLALHRSGALAERAERALALLDGRCLVWPRLCQVDRLADRVGLRRVGRRAVVASHFAHFGEEDCLRGRRGSGTIFFSGCNLRCVFCQNHEISWQLQGERVSPRRLAAMMLELQDAGCQNINWVTEHGMARRGLLVRHLVMPGLVDETEAILHWIAEDIGPGTYVNVMAQYHPGGRAAGFPEIDRHLYRSEFEHALAVADDLGLRRPDQRSRAAAPRLADAPA